MKTLNKLENWATFLIAIIIIYISINIIHFTWELAEPEGFWSFFYFTGLLTVVIVLFILAIAIIFLTIAGIIFLIKDFPKNLSLKNIAIGVGIGIVVVIITGTNLLFGSGVSLFINKSLADRYSYINRSEELMSENRFKEALDQSIKAYEKYTNKTSPSYFFILTRFFYNSEYGIKRMITKKYETTINYAFCIEQNRLNSSLAEPLYHRALVIASHPLLIKEEDYKIFPYMYLAELNRKKGNYLKAEGYFNQLIKLSDRASKEDLYYLCLAQEIFADYFISVGDLMKARELRRNNVTLWEKKHKNPQSLYYLSFLLGAASIEIITGNFNEAGKYLVKAAPIAEKNDDHIAYQTFLLMKGYYCVHVSKNGNGNIEILDRNWLSKLISVFTGNPDINDQFKKEAEKVFHKMTKYQKSINGEKSLEYAMSLRSLGIYYLEYGAIEKANQVFNEAFNIINKQKTTDSQLHYSALITLSMSEFYTKGYHSVRYKLKELEDFYFGTLMSNYLFLTEKEKESYKKRIDNNILSINSIYIAANTNESRIRLYNNIIATKEIALYANEKMRQYLSLLDYNEQAAFTEIIKLRDSVALIKADILKNAQNAIIIKEKERIIQNKIKKLPEFKAFDPRDIVFENIRDSLHDHDVAIEFIHSNKNNTEQYYAVIVKKGFLAPKLVPLFNESDLKKILQQTGNTEQRINHIYGRLKDSIYSLIWKPIEAEVPSKSSVYISVSGILNSISFPTLLENRDIDIVLLGSTRKITNINKAKGRNYTSAIVVGGVNYGSDSEINRKEVYANLPYTKVEINNIERIINASLPASKIFKYTNDSASEIVLHQMDQKDPDLIHLATHGYYHGYGYNSMSNTMRMLSADDNIDPMIKSGIVLASANKKSYVFSGNDGYFSAQEIARMKFTKLDLVVLSACETGLGDVIGTEGVFGLQRAFKLAGANSIIMSLWKVPDSATAELMKYFYENYFIRKLPKSKSLLEAQRSMKIQSKYASPFYWGAFILLEN